MGRSQPSAKASRRWLFIQRDISDPQQIELSTSRAHSLTDTLDAVENNAACKSSNHSETSVENGFTNSLHLPPLSGAKLAHPLLKLRRRGD
jgi:hypothetical protein